MPSVGTEHLLYGILWALAIVGGAQCLLHSTFPQIRDSNSYQMGQAGVDMLKILEL